MSVDKQMTFEEMAELVKPGLLNHIGKAFEEYTKRESMTVSNGEMTIAAGLAMEVGNNSDSEEEVRINVEAYYRFILHYAMRVFKSKAMSLH